ncbi:MAG: hypothetical protein OXI86_08305 [Candidatus Poribacteria bacterium]|nr:hypothetical protein [Candidatus Poribacteria bacterium]
MEIPWVFIGLVLWLVNLSAACGAVLMAGAAETITTPATKGKEVHDDLYARALVLAEDDMRLVVVTYDGIGMSIASNNNLRRAINKATGIPAENIVINCSHGHTAPGPSAETWERDKQPSTVDEATILYDEWLGKAEGELTYGRWFLGHIVEVAKRAAENLQPATLRVGRAPAQIGYNRRLMKDGKIVMAPNPKGAIVPWVDVLAAYGEDGRRIGVLFSYAAHPVIVIEPISAGFPGYAIKHLRNLLSTAGEPEGTFMFAQGCGGNINGHPLWSGFGACETAGLSLAFAVTRALNDGHSVQPAQLNVRSLDLSLPLEDPPPVAKLKELLKQDLDVPRYQKRRRALLAMAESGEPQFHPYPMSAFGISNEVCILFLPDETFAEYQLFADEISPFEHTIVYGYTNGRSMYIATKKDYELGSKGGYEAWAHPQGIGKYLRPRASCEQIIRDGITRLLNELKSDYE